MTADFPLSSLMLRRIVGDVAIETLVDAERIAGDFLREAGGSMELRESLGSLILEVYRLGHDLGYTAGDD